MTEYENLKMMLTILFPDCVLREEDPPVEGSHSYYLDVARNGRLVVVEYRPGRGFGITWRTDVGYGEGHDEIHRALPSALARLIGLLESETSSGSPLFTPSVPIAASGSAREISPTR